MSRSQYYVVADEVPAALVELCKETHYAETEILSALTHTNRNSIARSIVNEIIIGCGLLL